MENRRCIYFPNGKETLEIEHNKQLQGEETIYIKKDEEELAELMAKNKEEVEQPAEVSEDNLSKEEENYFEQLVINQTELNKLDLMEASFNSIEKYIIEDKDPEMVPPTIFLPATDQSFAKNVIDKDVTGIVIAHAQVDM